MWVTGREVMLYILQNNLENEIVIKNGLFVDFGNEEQVAARFKVGAATIKVWRKYGILRNGIKNGGTINRE